jgi:secondary thiamine-phosphate synthase enzyme
MASRLFVAEEERVALTVCSDEVTLRTEDRVQLIDVTELVRQRVRRSGVGHGLACIQTRHTTTAVIVNENEPLLLDDLERTLERLAPRGLAYSHDDLSRRSGVDKDERANGSAHCQAALLGASETLAIVGGELQLGRWQSIFLAELDGPRPRSFWVVVMGSALLPAPRSKARS